MHVPAQFAMIIRSAIKCGILLQLMSISGCISLSNIKSAEDFKMKSDEGIIVFYKPSGTNIFFRSGDLDGNSFLVDTGFPDNIISGADGDYVVRKVAATKPSRVFGAARIEQGGIYSPACDQEVPVFTIRPGVVQYVTHIDVTKNPESVGVTYRNRIADAKVHLEREYKMSNVDLVQGDFRIAKQGRCLTGGFVYIPIFVRY